MKNLTIAVIIGTAFAFLISACKKDAANPTVTPAATISIISPTANQVYHVGDTMHIQATIEGNVKMHGYEIAIVDLATGDTVYTTEDHSHQSTLNVDAHWCCMMPAGTNLRVSVSSALNHDGLEVVKTVDVNTAQ